MFIVAHENISKQLNQTRRYRLYFLRYISVTELCDAATRPRMQLW